ncbi:Gfo/Idh/MocA family protein [Streptomyces sp. NPDC017940]|uniref:Gfo/Idh/MocA family protein n=1 Tax=Streptomyces sp. NPDC017940 TaxID=3365017 RepID=UPI0037B4ADB3
MSPHPVRAGILGCGMVATEYATTLAASSSVDLTACADLDHERAQRLADQYGISAVPVVDLLTPETIDLVLILTPPPTHADLAHQAITARLRAVWIEKPLTTDPQEATALTARAEHAGVLLGAAPDTLLGPALQTAAAALRNGLIGDVRSATATLLSTGPERWHPAPQPFYAEHAGPLGDMGPYYLTALDYLLGPLRVRAATVHTRTDRRIRSGPHAGEGFTAHAPTYVAALLEIDDKVPVTLIASFDAAATQTPHLEIHGTEGTLVLPDPNFHNGEVLHRPYGARTAEVLPHPATTAAAGRGMGSLDLAEALRDGRAPRCSPQRAGRTIHLMAAIVRAGTAPPLTAQSPSHSNTPSI